MRALFLATAATLAGCRAPTSGPPEPAAPSSLGAAESRETAPVAPAARPSREGEPTRDPATRDGIAVVELFTSEGCNSCPPADELLAELAVQDAAHVYALSFHVDYWDTLGWPDRFATRTFTTRQHDYASSFRSRRVYTPQMIVNGTTEFVGSERRRAAAAIRDALAAPSDAKLSLRVETEDATSVRVAYGVIGAPAGTVLRLALVENEATTHVRSGENAGRTLRHVHVVRAFDTVDDPSRAGTRTLARQGGGAYEIVGYVQSTTPAPDGGLRIWGAGRAPRG